MSQSPQRVMPKKSEKVSSSGSKTSQSLQRVMPKKSECSGPTPRKSPRLSQSVEKENALQGKLVIPKMGWNKICGGPKMKEKRVLHHYVWRKANQNICNVRGR